MKKGIVEKNWNKKKQTKQRGKRRKGEFTEDLPPISRALAFYFFPRAAQCENCNNVRHLIYIKQKNKLYIKRKRNQHFADFSSCRSSCKSVLVSVRTSSSSDPFNAKESSIMLFCTSPSSLWLQPSCMQQECFNRGVASGSNKMLELGLGTKPLNIWFVFDPKFKVLFCRRRWADLLYINGASRTSLLGHDTTSPTIGHDPTRTTIGHGTSRAPIGHDTTSDLKTPPYTTLVSQDIEICLGVKVILQSLHDETRLPGYQNPPQRRNDCEDLDHYTQPTQPEDALFIWSIFPIYIVEHGSNRPQRAKASLSLCLEES